MESNLLSLTNTEKYMFTLNRYNVYNYLPYVTV